MNSDNNNIQQVRYSDEELEEFKVLILEKLAQAKESLETLNANLTGGEHSTDDTAPTFKILKKVKQWLRKRKTQNLSHVRRNTSATLNLP